MLKAAALLIIGSLLTLVIEIFIFTYRGQIRMWKKSDKFKQEFLDELSYFDSPRGLDQDIKNMLDKEISKRDEAKNYHPAKKRNSAFWLDTSNAIEPIQKESQQQSSRRNSEYEVMNISLFEQFRWPYS